jgi:hypothetical protein
LYAEKNKLELNVRLYFKATFIIYAEDATDIFLRHRVRHHIFADDIHYAGYQTRQAAASQ